MRAALDLVVCPECSHPAEVVRRFTLSSTSGPVGQVMLRCILRHWFLTPAEPLTPWPTAALHPESPQGRARS